MKANLIPSSNQAGERTHTPEPWSCESDWCHIFSLSPEYRIIAAVVMKPTQKNKIDNHPDAQRIVSCVNALAGLNPAAVGEVVEAATALRKVDGSTGKFDALECVRTGKALDAALAKLTSQP